MKIIISDTKNKIEIIDIELYEKISDLKEKIKIKKGINYDLILHFEGAILEDDQTVEEIGLEENNQVIYMGTFRAGKNY